MVPKQLSTKYIFRISLQGQDNGLNIKFLKIYFSFLVRQGGWTRFGRFWQKITKCRTAISLSFFFNYWTIKCNFSFRNAMARTHMGLKTSKRPIRLKQYEDTTLQRAIKMGLSVKVAKKKFEVPKSTIVDYLVGKVRLRIGCQLSSARRRRITFFMWFLDYFFLYFFLLRH